VLTDERGLESGAVEGRFGIEVMREIEDPRSGERERRRRREATSSVNEGGLEEDSMELVGVERGERLKMLR